jgi:hypothetical protein
MKEAKTKAEASWLARLVMSAYLKSEPIASRITDLQKSAMDLSLHNTRNLNAEINSKLLSLLDEDQLLRAENKLNYIEMVVRKSPHDVARETLSILKSTNLIMSEYNIIDYVHPSAKLRRNDLAHHKVHKVVLMSYYLYEQEFIKRGISVKLDRTEAECYFHFTTIRTALSQLFDNCLKFCKPQSSVVIHFAPKRDIYFEVELEMTSIFFSNAESARLLLPGERGLHPIESSIDGKGAGLSIVQQMMLLNRGYFEFEALEATKHYYKDIPYSNNYFRLGLLANARFYEPT